MRLTDDRYTREREACELGLRLLRYEARSCLIRTCTGLSEDRVRKLYKPLKSSTNQRLKRGKARTKSRHHAQFARTLEASVLDAG